MSITVVSTPQMPMQGTVTDSGSDASATQDFAILLLGQLATNAAQPVAAANMVTDLPITGAATAEAPPVDAAALLVALGLAAAPTEAKPADKAVAEKTENDGASTDAAASVLAALGLATTPSGVPAQAPGSIEQKAAEPLAAVSGSAEQKTEKAADPLAAASDTAEQKAAKPLAALSGTAGENLLANGQTESLKTAPAVPAATMTDDKAAKFAVVSATTEKTASAEPFASDTLPTNAIASLSANAPGHVSHLALKYDSALSVNTSVRDQNWSTDLGQKIVWLASNDKQSAQLTLNPPQLGPIEVSLDVDKGNASVSFASANAEVRDAIETALPRLREMFASAGIELGQTNVGAQSFSQQQSGSNEQKPGSSRWMGDNAILAAETTGSLQTGAFGARQGNGMVDIFA